MRHPTTFIKDLCSRSIQQTRKGKKLTKWKNQVLTKKAIRTSGDEVSFDPAFLPYHSRYLNSTSSCKEADIVSGSQSTNM